MDTVVEDIDDGKHDRYRTKGRTQFLQSFRR